MPNLTPQSPLLQPVTLDGQTYFTSQYFHAQYQQNTPGQGKHTRLDSFMRLLQSMEAYGVYIEQGDIRILTWEEVKSLTTNSGLVSAIKDLQPIFAAAGYRPLTLLNATAQAALSHHLDDLTSQAMSVAINQHVGRKAQPALRTVEQDLAFFQSCLTLLRDIGQLEVRDTLMVADKVRTLLIGPAGNPAGNPGGGTTALPTFFIADRVRELGYHLNRNQEASLVGPLSKKVAAEYRLRHKDDLDPETRDPQKALRYVDGAAREVNYYAREAASWIDPIVQSYLVSVLGSGLSRQEGTR